MSGVSRRQGCAYSFARCTQGGTAKVQVQNRCEEGMENGNTNNTEVQKNRNTKTQEM